jgi:hypothetical protein
MPCPTIGTAQQSGSPGVGSAAAAARRLQQLGIPTLDGGPLGPARLREASVAELAERVIPILDEHVQALDDSRPTATWGQLGIPMLPETPGSRHVRLIESESGQVLSRIS